MEHKAQLNTYLENNRERDMIKKAIYLFALVTILTACNTYRNVTMKHSLLVGTWGQPNVTLDLKSNGQEMKWIYTR